MPPACLYRLTFPECDIRTDFAFFPLSSSVLLDRGFFSPFFLRPPPSPFCLLFLATPSQRLIFRKAPPPPSSIPPSASKERKGREDDPSFPTFSTKLKKKERKRSRELAKVDCAYLLLLPSVRAFVAEYCCQQSKQLSFPSPSLSLSYLGKASTLN